MPADEEDSGSREGGETGASMESPLEWVPGLLPGVYPPDTPDGDRPGRWGRRAAIVSALLALALLVLASAGPIPPGQPRSAAVADNPRWTLQEAREHIHAVLPQGTPDYAPDPALAYENLESVRAWAQADRAIQLEGDLHHRYVRIGSHISCEFCCPAHTLVFPDGSPACGCIHSAALRGTAKYLLATRGGEMSDEQVLGELVKWKTRYFPGPMVARLLQEDIEAGRLNTTTIEEALQASGGSCG